MNSNLAYEKFSMSVDEFYEFVDVRPESEHWELYYGIPFCLAAPGYLHQKILANLLIQFSMYFSDKKCEVLPSPFDVLLFEDTRFPCILQPDLLVFCDKSQNDGHKLHGPPDLVVEVWSPSNIKKHRLNKIQMYIDAGVKEIWEIFTETEVVKISTLINEVYEVKTLDLKDIIKSQLYSDLNINLKNTL